MTTQAAIQFRHEAARSVHAPGFYLHLAPDEIFAGVGIWQPDSATAGRIRDRIVEDPDACLTSSPYMTMMTHSRSSYECGPRANRHSG